MAADSAAPALASGSALRQKPPFQPGAAACAATIGKGAGPEASSAVNVTPVRNLFRITQLPGMLYNIISLSPRR